MESSSNKDVYKSIFTLVKSLDEQKQKYRTVSELFSDDIQQKRKNLVELCQKLLLSDFDGVTGLGKKARDILWRKGYYDQISIVKYIFAKNKTTEGLSLIEALIYEGISVFKTIILKLDSEFNLDLGHTINMNVIQDENTETTSNIHNNDHHTIMEISYAWDIVHASLVSIGDLYRYLLGFKLSPETVTPDVVAVYYEQAFKLNPTIGMAQNQLGTLYAGKNYEIDSVFHYLYALLCKIPFELSEGNVNKIFQKNALFLENETSSGTDSNSKIKNFVARFILVVDIFFYDKEVTDFTDLCHSILIDLKYLLDDQGFLTEEILFKMTSILLFCLHKLKLNGSKKVHSMNALLVALASELVDNCNMSVVQFISGKEAQNIIFHDKYNRVFTKFENFVRDFKRNVKTADEVIHPTIMAHAKDPHEGPSTSSPILTGSDERNSTSNKENKLGRKKGNDVNKKTNSRHRRRRPQLSNCSDTDASDMEEIEHNLDESDSDDSFSSYNDDSSIDSDWSDDENENNASPGHTNDSGSDSGDDIIVLEEEIIYPSNDESSIGDPFKSNTFIDKEEDILSELFVKFEALSGVKYRNAYRKVDPNIIMEYCAKEKCLKALKVLFDWMYLNPDIVVGCYVSNPEFIHKIMRLINYLNIDIFTRKIYFDRCFLKNPDFRPDLRYLFDIRRTIPIYEDEQLKRFAMFEILQQSIDWELTSKLQVTHQEIVFLRLFKLIDYGFHLSKMRKFHYYFCAKDRIFIERNKKRSGEREKGSRRNRNGRVRKERRRRGSNDRRNRRNRNRRRRDQDREIIIEAPKIAKRYLKNNLDQNSGDEMVKLSELNIGNGVEGKSTSEKMAALWLHNEVSSLEHKMKDQKNTNVFLTPYIVVDTRALTEFTSIVKNLLKTKKFVILVPLSVLSELDDLKKNNEQIGEQARNVIKWLEQEFTKGNRFLRSQRQNEILPLSLVKVPKKLDRDAGTFFHIVNFCNYIVTNNKERDSSDMITFLTGDSLTDRKTDGFSYQGILDAIPVKHEQIINFYSKYKKK